jgi:hypothetical protein
LASVVVLTTIVAMIAVTIVLRVTTVTDTVMIGGTVVGVAAHALREAATIVVGMAGHARVLLATTIVVVRLLVVSTATTTIAGTTDAVAAVRISIVVVMSARMNASMTVPRVPQMPTPLGTLVKPSWRDSEKNAWLSPQYKTICWLDPLYMWSNL